MLALYGFPACVLQVYFKDVRVGEMLSRWKCAIEMEKMRISFSLQKAVILALPAHNGVGVMHFLGHSNRNRCHFCCQEKSSHVRLLRL